MEKGNEKWQQAGKRRADRYEQSADKEKSFTITANWHKGVPYNYFKESKPIKVGMNVEEVKVRKHEVDIPGLQICILDHYAKCSKNKKEIAKELNDKYSTVEHYFRKLGSDSFSIPSEEHWPQLKEILGITTDKFDKQIMEFEYRDGVFESTQRVYSDQGKSPTLTATNKEQMIETRPKQVGVAVDIKGHDQIKRVYSPEGKSPTVTTCGGGHREPKVALNELPNKSNTIKASYYKSSRANFENDTKKGGKFSATGVQQEDLTWRKLTPLECERLQTVPDNYTDHVSNTQRYKMLGNGWTVAVIKHIFKNMEVE
jgi:site-specific DNA-cytosine methylase